MPSKRTFYKSTLTVTILSEYPMDDVGLADMVSAGDCSINYELEAEKLGGKQMAAELLEQQSDPEFFCLTQAGEDA